MNITLTTKIRRRLYREIRIFTNVLRQEPIRSNVNVPKIFQILRTYKHTYKIYYNKTLLQGRLKYLQ